MKLNANLIPARSSFGKSTAALDFWANKLNARCVLDSTMAVSKLAHRKRSMEMAYELEPDEVYMSPKCTLWSPVQAINMHCEADWDELWERRDFDHEIHLKFCKKLVSGEAWSPCPH